MEPLGREWREYIDERIEALTAECTSTDVDDRKRSEAAHRLNELRELLDLPAALQLRKKMILQSMGAQDGY